MSELIAFAAEIIFVMIVVGTYYKSEKFRQKIKGIGLVVEKHEKQFFLLMILSTVIMSLGFINAGHDWGGDFSQYLAQTRAILDGTVDEQVAAGTYIADNSVVGLCPDVYPWGYCLMLLPVYALFGMNFFALKLVGAFYFVLFVGLIYLFFRKRFSAAGSLLASLMFAFNESYLMVIDSVISDMPFLFFSVLGIYALYEMLRKENKQFIWAFVCGISTFLAFFCRTNGIVSILTVVCVDLLLIADKIFPFLNRWVRKCGFAKQNIGSHVLIYVIFFGGKMISASMLPKAGSGYNALISQLSFDTIVNNIILYLKEGVFEFFRMGEYMAVVAEAFFILMILVGLIHKFWEELPLNIYTLGMTVLLIIYPGFQGVRYLFTVIPFWVILAIRGVQGSIGWLIQRWNINKSKVECVSGKLLAGCLCVFFMAFSARMILVYHVLHSYTTNQAYTEDALAMYDYINENTKDADIIVSCKPRVIWLNTGRLGFSIEDGDDKYLKADYILFIDGDGLSETKKKIQEHGGGTSLVYEGQNCELYRIQ